MCYVLVIKSLNAFGVVSISLKVLLLRISELVMFSYMVRMRETLS